MTDVSTRLKITVERAVRPVRASNLRKDTMRNELLAHIQQGFDVEAAKAGDEQAAIDRAIERFGDPKELTCQLQQTVPRMERTLCWSVPLSARWENIVRRKPGESIFRHAIWLALRMLLLYMVFLVALMLLLAAFSKSAAFIKIAGVLVGFGVVFATTMPSLTILSNSMQDVMAAKWAGGKSLGRLLVCTCLSFLVLIAMGFALALLIEWRHGYPIFRLEHLPVLLLIAAAVAVSLPVIARFAAADRHRYEQWESLDIT